MATQSQGHNSGLKLVLAGASSASPSLGVIQTLINALKLFS